MGNCLKWIQDIARHSQTLLSSMSSEFAKFLHVKALLKPVFGLHKWNSTLILVICTPGAKRGVTYSTVKNS